MKLVKLFLYGAQRIGRDGTTGSVELAAVQLDDGRYVGVNGPGTKEDYGCVGTELDEHGWPLLGDELEDEEFRQFELVVDEVGELDAGWSDNPVVYGPDDTEFEVLGTKVTVYSVQECELEDSDQPDLSTGPFVVDLTKPPKLVHATLEPNFHNNDGTTVTLYFDGVPNEEQVWKACGGLSLPLGVNVNDPFFAFEEHPTPVSERANLHRYEVYPTG